MDVVILNSAEGIFRGSGVKGDLCGKRSLNRKFIVRPTMKYASSRFFMEASPLLEKERDVGRLALRLDGRHPGRCHGTSPGVALAAHDHPFDVVQALERDRIQKRFDRKEMNSGRNRDEVGNSYIGPALVFDGGAQPDVRPTGTPIDRQTRGDELGSLRQNLPVQVRALADQIPQICPPGGIDFLIEHISKRAAKYSRANSGGGSSTVPC